jgi:ParB-like chromosome segregation protein Spo0J
MPLPVREVVAVMAERVSAKPSSKVIPASMEAGTHRQQDSTGKHGSWNTSPAGQHRQAWELERIASRTAPASMGAGTHRQQDSTGKYSNRQKTRTADYQSERQQAIKPPPMREVVNVVCK